MRNRSEDLLRSAGLWSSARPTHLRYRCSVSRRAADAHHVRSRGGGSAPEPRWECRRDSLHVGALLALNQARRGIGSTRRSPRWMPPLGLAGASVARPAPALGRCRTPSHPETRCGWRMAKLPADDGSPVTIMINPCPLSASGSCGTAPRHLAAAASFLRRMASEASRCVAETAQSNP